jgi:hypothetical protein
MRLYRLSLLTIVLDDFYNLLQHLHLCLIFNIVISSRFSLYYITCFTVATRIARIHTILQSSF